MILAGIVVIEPIEVNVRRIKRLVLTKTHRCSFGPAHTVDNSPLVVPFLAFGMTVHETERAGIAVKDTQRIPKATGARIIRPAGVIVVA